MNRIAVVLSLAASLLCPALVAQGAPPAPAANASASCLPSNTLEELIKALDDAVSGPADKDRSCLRALFLPDARLIPVGKRLDGVFGPHILTVDDWINAVAQRGNSLLSEHQIKVKSETYGHVAHLWSTYELHITPDAKTTATGINSIQAVNNGTGWRIQSILWESDATAGPVPPQYLP